MDFYLHPPSYLDLQPSEAAEWDDRRCQSCSPRIPSVSLSEFQSDRHCFRSTSISSRPSTSYTVTEAREEKDRIRSLRRSSSCRVASDRIQTNTLAPIIEDPYQGQVPVNDKRVRWAVYSPSSSPTETSHEVIPWTDDRTPQQKRDIPITHKDVASVMQARRKYNSASFVFASEVSSLAKVLDQPSKTSSTRHSLHPYANVQPVHTLHTEESHPSKTFLTAMARTKKARPTSLTSFSSRSNLEPVYEVPPSPSPGELQLRRTSSRTSYSSNASSEVMTSSSICLKAPDVVETASINSMDRWPSMRNPFGDSKGALSKLGRLVRMGSRRLET